MLKPRSVNLPATGYRMELTKLASARSQKGRWVPVFMEELAFLTPLEAVILGMVINLAKERAGGSGWMLLTFRYLRDGPLQLSTMAQERVLDSLARMGLMEVSWKGEPKRRHVRLSLVALKCLGEGRLVPVHK